MIEVQQARTGQPYLVFNQQRLSSAIDPEAEGRKWVEHYENRLAGAEVIYVLGLGSGYHVLELAKKYPAALIRAFDVHSDVVATVSRLHAYSNQVSLTAVTGAYDTLVSLEELKKPFVILKHAPSISLNSALYRDFLLFLSGRHGEYCRFYQKLIPHYQAFDQVKSPITIHQMEQVVIEKEETLSQEDRAWLMLRELVK